MRWKEQFDGNQAESKQKLKCNGENVIDVTLFSLTNL